MLANRRARPAIIERNGSRIQEDDMRLPYTICFIQRNHQILMIHRKKDPNKDKWNGVGGKIEPGESPLAACIREVREETGLRVRNVAFRGIVSFNQQSGMYVFTAESSSGEIRASEEGELEWKSLLWVMTSPDATTTLPYFLPEVLGANPPVEHAFTFVQDGAEYGDIVDYEMRPLRPEWALVDQPVELLRR
jgi:8-oxo-dGTP diphosphatase